jgi:hypothetical protein
MLFALLTAQLEDGAAMAAEGQGRQTLAAQHERAQALEAQVRDVHTVAQALVDITSRQVGADADVTEAN